ncbi:hypothetical protein [Desulfovulcanus sp.]
MSKELVQKSHFYFLACLCFLFSLSLHFYLLSYLKFYTLPIKSEAVPPFILELDVDWQRFKSRRVIAGPGAEAEVITNQSRDYRLTGQISKLQKNDAVVKLSLSEDRMRAHLKRIKAMILTCWAHASPPGLGQALVLIRLNAQGQIVHSEIQTIYGSSEFVRFVRLFLDDLANLKFPRLEGMDNFWLECEFKVESV